MGKGRAKGRAKGRENGGGEGRGERAYILGTPAAGFALFVEPGTGGAGVVGEGVWEVGLGRWKDHGRVVGSGKSDSVFR